MSNFLCNAWPNKDLGEISQSQRGDAGPLCSCASRSSLSLSLSLMFPTVTQLMVVDVVGRIPDQKHGW